MVIRLAWTPDRVFRWLVALAAGLTLISYALRMLILLLPAEFTGRGTLLRFIARFAVANEASIPTWFSTMILFAAAVLFALIARQVAGRGEAYARHWAGLALLLLLMSVEEIAGFHEMLSLFFYRSLDTGGLLRYPWIIVGLALVLTVASFYRRFFLALPERTRRHIVLSVGVYLAGAVGFEAISGAQVDAIPEIVRATTVTWNDLGVRALYELGLHMEDLLEMLGVAILIYGASSYWLQYLHPIQIEVARDVPTRSDPVAAQEGRA